MSVFQKKSDLYRAFSKEATVIGNDENCKTLAFEYAGKRIILKKTLKKANKRVIVSCHGHCVSAVHLYPVTHHTVASEEEFNIDVADMQDKNSVAIVVVSGKPGLIKGLDEGIFVSANNRTNDKSGIFVMSEARFKSFDF